MSRRVCAVGAAIAAGQGIITLCRAGAAPGGGMAGRSARGPEVYRDRPAHLVRLAVHRPTAVPQAMHLAGATSGLDGAGFNTVLRTWPNETGRQLYTVFSNPTQHRAPRSVISARYQRIVAYV